MWSVERGAWSVDARLVTKRGLRKWRKPLDETTRSGHAADHPKTRIEQNDPRPRFFALESHASPRRARPLFLCTLGSMPRTPLRGVRLG